MARDKNVPLHRMCRCGRCYLWQSTNPEENTLCGSCGGYLIPVDMAKHVAELPAGKESADGGTLVEEKRK